MNLQEAIRKENSKEQKAKIVSWIGQSQERFDQLFELFISGEYRVVQRAVWPLSNCILQHPTLVAKHYKRLIANLQTKGLNDVVKRNTLRLLQEVAIPKKHQGVVMNICFAYVASPDEAIAVKAFALTLLQKLAQHYPAIIPEVKLLIEDQMERATPAFKVRAKRFLKATSG